MGEFGMRWEQAGGVLLLSDQEEIASANGWHFCLWSFRSDPGDASVLDFDYEKWDPAYMDEITSWW